MELPTFKSVQKYVGRLKKWKQVRQVGIVFNLKLNKN